MDISSDLVTVRDLSESDIPFILKYWFDSPDGFIEAMGVDRRKMPKKSEMEVNLKKKILDNFGHPHSRLNSLVITFNEMPIGYHSVFPLVEGDYGIFHAHIWDPGYRKRGIALQSYPKACRVFIKRFNLNRILFKTPVQNTGAIRVKEKLGIRLIGEEVISYGIIKEDTLAKVFELTSDELSNL